jgi:Tfp pilus assembly protein PilV
MNFLAKRNSAGDTIVEVLISMAVLAVVLSTAYATTTRSFHAGLNSQYRDQAGLVAQQQLELLKSADISTNPTIDTYKVPDHDFCINPTNMARVDLSSSNPTCTTPVGAPASSESQYLLADSYDGGKRIFTITTQWPGENNGFHKVVLYYKASDSYVP